MGITVGIATQISMATEKSRVNLNSFYKSYDSTKVVLNNPVSLEANVSKTFDISTSNFIILISDKFGLENEVLELTFTDGTQVLTFKQVGFFMSSISNMTEVTIKNTHTAAVDFNLVY